MFYHDASHMRMRLAPLCGILVPALAIALLGASPVPQLPVPKGAAMIYDPGSGDYSGFRIVVQPNGHAVSVDGAGRSTIDLQNDISARFFADLHNASLASKNPTSRCSSDAVPVSDDVTIKWSGKAWSGLSCATDTQLLALAGDAKNIERALYVQTYRARPMYVYIGANGPQYSGGVYGTAALYAGSGSGGYPSFNFSGGYSSSPYSSYPAGSSPTGGLPTTGLPGSAPSGSLPTGSPFTGLPTTGLPGTSPFGASPFGSSPYSGGF
jgi:hypothetical protein